MTTKTMPAEEPDSSFTTGKQIGDYLLDALVSMGSNTSSWFATQVSVQREVIFCALDTEHGDDPEVREAFISDVRTKASVDHPLIASVLEAVNEGPLCYFAMEKLHGTHLSDFHDEGSSIAPIHIARIIHNISGSCHYLETNKITSLPLLPQDIFIDDNYHCRIANMAVSGKMDPAVSTRDKELVGHLLQDMVEPNQPGATRTNSLLGYMADLERVEPMSWHRIHDLAGEIERQLARPGTHGQIKSPTMQLDPIKARYSRLYSSLGKIIPIAAIILILGGLVYYFSSQERPPEKRQMQDMVHIPAGKYAGPNGYYVKVREFWIDAHEVTIGEYAEFLEVVDTLSDDMKTVYQHEDQPGNKTSHNPDDWEKLYAAAKQGGKWNDLDVDLNYPVVGIDWWDAYAYAEWKGRRLPTREEWYVACTSGSDPSKLTGTGWKPVDETEKTAQGLHGMAGNVSEWMRKKGLDPTDPSQPPRYMISGASHLRPKYGARAREWVENRNLRRPDIGFRTYSNSPQGD